ncbi:MAG: hypothetical protein ACOY3L_14310 [Pseudomonadota bacterium]
MAGVPRPVDEPLPAGAVLIEDEPPPPGAGEPIVDEPLPPGAVLIQDEPPPLGAGEPIVDEPLPAGAVLIQDEPPDAGPPITPRFIGPAGKGMPADEVKAATEQFLSTTAVGRILDAFGQGAKDGWGVQPLGLSPEAEKSLREVGVFNDLNDQYGSVLKTFNEAILRPTAAAADVFLRGLSATTVGAASAVGQVAAEVPALSTALGFTPETAKNRMTRDALALADTLAFVSGGEAVYAGVRPLRRATGPSATERLASETAPIAERVAPETPKRPEMPQDVFQTPSTGAVNRAGNINLDRIAAPEDVKDVIREAANSSVISGGEPRPFDTARRGTIPLAQTEEMAQALGMTPEQLAARKIGQAFNAEEITAARKMLVQSATDVRNLAAKAAGGSDADLLAFQEAVLRHQTIQEQVAGLTAEAGRALSAFRITAGEARDAANLGKVLEAAGGRQSIEAMARMVSELDTPAQVSKFMMDARKAKASDMFIEAWINALLSGPKTHVTNIISNTLTALWSVPETGLAAVIGGVRRAAGGAEERVLLSEARARLFGFVQGAQEGTIAAWRAFKTEMPSDALSKIEAQKYQAIPGAVGQVARLPTRALMAEDEFFKAIGRRQEINALAYRQAATEGLTGDALAARVADLVANPTDDMLEKARATAQYQTFQSELGDFGKSVQRLANSHPLVKIVVPFVRTPFNLLKYAQARSPLGIFSKELRDTMAGKYGSVARDTAQARVILGTGIAVTAITLAAKGLITGSGPKDPRQRALLYATGWQPYSVRIGDTWYSYARLDPFSTLLGVAADAYDIASRMSDPEAEDVGALVVASISNNLVNKTWLKGTSELIEAINDPERYGAKWLRTLAATVVPTGVAQLAQTEDPYLREARTIVDAIKARVPGFSQTLLPKRDIWGEPIELGGSAGPDLISPIYTNRLTHDPVAQELLSLGIWPSKLDRKIRGVDLTDKQYDDYQRIAGRLTKFMLDNLVRSPGWGQIPAFARTETITRVIDNTRETARTQMLMVYPDILKQAMDAKLKALGVTR